MKLGVCPKCGCPDIRVGIDVPAKLGNLIPVSNWTQALLDYYVCTYCGYVESYIASARDLQKIVDNWPRVPHKEPEERDE